MDVSSSSTCKSRRFRKFVERAALVALCLAVMPWLPGCNNSDHSQDADSQIVPDANPAKESDSKLTAELYGDLSSFSTSTLGGGTFTSDDLADYDLTMVNVWTTSCPYCIREMPGIELLYQDLPSNVNLVTICVDADINLDLAHKILDEADATFPTLLNSDSLMECFVGNVTGVPTTVYVDKQGEIVEYPQVGAPTTESDELVAKRYRDQIQNCLEEVV